MKQILIRNMLEHDIEAVIQIERVSFPTPWSEISFFNEIYKSRSISKVAVSDEDTVGYICAEYIQDEGHILDLAVRPDYRGMGIASMLVRNIIEELRAKGCRSLYLEVRASNYAANRLYHGLGFRVGGIRKRYYINPVEDGLIMVLDLSANDAAHK